MSSGVCACEGEGIICKVAACQQFQPPLEPHVSPKGCEFLWRPSLPLGTELVASEGKTKKERNPNPNDPVSQVSCSKCSSKRKRTQQLEVETEF